MYVCMHIHVGHAWNVNLRSHLGNQVSLICALYEDIDRLRSWEEQRFLVMEDEDSAAGLHNICIDIRQSGVLNTSEEWRL